MTALERTDDIFFRQAGLDRVWIESLVSDALAHSDDGELFLEYSQSEALSWDDGRLKSASFDTNQGFGLRAVVGETQGYAHAADLSQPALKRAAETVKAVQAGHGGTTTASPPGTNRQLYIDGNPLGLEPFESKVKLLADIDAYA